MKIYYTLSTVNIAWLFIYFYACLVWPYFIDIELCKALEVLNYKEKTSCEMMQGHNRKEEEKKKKKQFLLDLWFKKTQLSQSLSSVPWEVRYGCHQSKVSGPQQLWWSNMNQRHEAQPKCSASDAGTARMLCSPPKKLPIRLRPRYLYYSPSRQLSMCGLSTHARWEWMALLFTLTITYKNRGHAV